MLRFIRARGFTVIELLVCVFIISLLLAMLLPTLKNARLQAKSIACLNNLKQTYLCISCYASDHADYVHATWGANNCRCSKTWPYVLCSKSYVAQKDILVCPTNKPFRFVDTSTTYGQILYNSIGLSNSYDCVRISLLRPKSVMLADSSNNARSQGYGFPGGVCVHLRHLGRANVCITDGRALSLPRNGLSQFYLTVGLRELGE